MKIKRSIIFLITILLFTVCLSAAVSAADVGTPWVSVSNSPSTGDPVLTWEQTEHAVEYKIYRSTEPDSGFKRIAAVTGTEFEDDSAVVGKEYYYYVRAFDSNEEQSDKSNYVSAYAKLESPTITGLTGDTETGKNVLTWSAVKGAEKYQVYRSTEAYGEYSLMLTTSKNSYKNTKATAGQTYYYKVRAVHAVSGSSSDFSGFEYRTCDLPKPTVKKVVCDPDTGKIIVQWSEIKGASYYKLYRAVGKNSGYVLIENTAETSFVDKEVSVGTAYYYKVKAIHDNTDANSVYSGYKYRTCDLPRPENVKIGNKASTGKITLQWSKVDGATGYTVYRATSKTGTYTALKTVTGTSFTNTSAEVGKTYYYKIKAIYSNTAANSAYTEYKYRKCDLPQPVVTISNVEETGKVKLTWKAITGATGYQVYRQVYGDDTWTMMKELKGTSYVNTSAIPETKYSYKVMAIHKYSSANSAYSAVKTRTCGWPKANTDSFKMKPGTTKTIEVTLASIEKDEPLTWKSSNTKVVTVKDGVVTGVKNGTVTITCKTESGRVVADCDVKVCNLKQVALTFDDGPSSAYTDDVLDLLEKYDVDATFFLVGNRISTDTGAVKRMADEGHEIGYHTWSHTYFSNMSKSQIKADLEKFQKAVKKASGKEATVYRAPGGDITKTALQTIDMPHILWNVDTRDWETRNSTSVKNAILNNLKDGNIILLHDIHGTTYTGTAAAIKYVYENDLDVEFVTVTELLSRDGTPPKAGKTYYND